MSVTTDAEGASTALAYKAYEIEEWVDVYFFRRLGIVVAHAARFLRVSPNAVSVLAGLVGAAGGALLAHPQLGLLGVALLFAHGVVDSADGQLARMTGQVSELGRVLDGVAGYVTHVAVYAAILVAARSSETWWWLVAGVVSSGMCTAAHAQMYDYHRTTYTAIVLKRRPTSPDGGSAVGGWLGSLVAVYLSMQRRLVGAHGAVEAVVASRSVDGVVGADMAHAYRQSFYGLVRGWNLMGDNMRRFVIAGVVWAQHVEWFVVATLLPLNVTFAVLWLLQRRADRRFVRAYDRAHSGSGPA